MKTWMKVGAKMGTTVGGLAAAALLGGCGASQDFGGSQRSLGGDLSPGYNSPLSSRYNDPANKRAAGLLLGTYPKIETQFQLDKLPGDPFDYEIVNVQVTLKKPDGGTLDVPAFFDGDTTWRMRFTPNQPGTWSVVSVKLNREIVHESKMETREWNVKGDPQAGFVRIDKGDHSRFVFDSGARYYPLGHNQAWHSGGLPDIPELFGKMHTAGENWSRVWMNHWDGKNLDWNSDKKKQGKLGEIDLESAKRWDAIVDAAEKNEIYFQLTLQHHGQVSADVNPNWDDNPYNVKNGGFLTNPEDFFTDPKARALTKRKLYYILARWGYSPNILAWELFNEVQFTAAARAKQWEQVAMWHREMALFLKQFDNYHHLITTSSATAVPLDSPIWETVDYAQIHTYPPDLLTGLDTTSQAERKKLDKPIFVGEFGPQDLKDTTGRGLHLGLWTSLMQNPSGAAQYWSWDEVEKNDLYGQFAAAAKFVTASGLANQGGLVALNLPVVTQSRSALRFAPGGGYGNATQNEFVVGESGVPSGIEKFPSFLQGENHRAMMPKPLTLQVNYPQAGTLTVTVGQVAKAGAKLTLRVDNGKTAQADYASAEKDYTPTDKANLQIAVPAGAHTLIIENTGSDWVVVRQIALSDYAPGFVAPARMSKDFIVAWVYSRDNVDAAADKASNSSSCSINLTGLKKGKYTATWWDTQSGKSLLSADLTIEKEKDPALITTPPIARDIALYVVKAGTPPPGSGKIKGKTAKAKRTSAPNTASGEKDNAPGQK